MERFSDQVSNRDIGTDDDRQSNSSALEDPNNFAKDYPKRMTRNTAPKYNGTKKRSSTVGNSKRALLKNLTKGRKETITQFLTADLGQPGKYGKVGSKSWLDELKKQLNAEGGRRKKGLLSSLDVKRWLKNPQFDQLLKKLQKDSDSDSDHPVDKEIKKETPKRKLRGEPVPVPAKSPNSVSSGTLFVPITDYVQPAPISSSSSSAGDVDADAVVIDIIQRDPVSNSGATSGNLAEPLVDTASAFVVATRRNIRRPVALRPGEGGSVEACQQEPVVSNQSLEQARNEVAQNSQMVNHSGGNAAAVIMDFNPPLPIYGTTGNFQELIDAFESLQNAVNSVRLSYNVLLQLRWGNRCPAAMAVMGYLIDTLLAFTGNYFNPRDFRFRW